MNRNGILCGLLLAACSTHATPLLPLEPGTEVDLREALGVSDAEVVAFETVAAEGAN